MRNPNTVATIIIVNWNNKNKLIKCLESLKRQSDRRFEVIVVDNGSSDGSVDALRKHFSTIRLVALNKNYGFSKANNVGFQYVESKYFITLNNDTVVARDWFAQMVEAMDARPEAGLAASKMLLFRQPEIIDRIGDSYTLAGAGVLKGRGNRTKANNEEKIQYVFGACAGAAMYRTSMIRQIGLFDEDFFLLYEDVDLSFRAQLNGYKCIYVPQAVVYHHCSNKIGHDSSTSVYYGHRNLEWVYFQNMPISLLLLTLPLHFIYDLCALIFFFLKGHFIVYLKAKIDATKGIKKLIRKRKIVQKEKSVSASYILKILEKETFIERLLTRSTF